MTGAAPPALTLAEELLLLAWDPVRGRPVIRQAYLGYGLAGAALADLEAAGRVTVERGDRIAVTTPLPLNDPVLDTALAALPGPAKRNGVRAHRWVRRMGRSSQGLCVRRLEERGALRREARRALGLFPHTRFPAGPVDLLGPAHARFHAAVEAGLPDHRSRLLAALASATGLDAKLLPGSGFRLLRRDLKHLVKEVWTVRAVHRAVQEDKNSANSGG